jgi:hypothetical protein
VRPLLPAWVDRLELTGLRVAGSVVAIRFERQDAEVVAEVTSTEGATLDVEVEHG